MTYHQSPSPKVEISLKLSETATAASFLASACPGAAESNAPGSLDRALAKLDEAAAVAGWLREEPCVALTTEEAWQVLEMLTARLDSNDPKDRQAEQLWKVRLELDRALHASSLPAVNIPAGHAQFPGVSGH